MNEGKIVMGGFWHFQWVDEAAGGGGNGGGGPSAGVSCFSCGQVSEEAMMCPTCRL